MASTLIAKPDTKLASVFELGAFDVWKQTFEKSHSSAPPKPLKLLSPTTKGTYPVVVFLHGFALSNEYYNQLLIHIASHGYIVVAPQLYSVIPHSITCDGEKEIKATAKVTEWLSEGLPSLLPDKVHPNLKKLALSGHSRGGKTAFSLAVDKNETDLGYSVLVGIDPVAGVAKGHQVTPNLLTYKPNSLDTGYPVLVIGTGLGEDKLNLFTPPCAPDGMNHKEFYNESQSPAYHFVAQDYGHMDMLDDDVDGTVGKLAVCVCKAGKGAKDTMRRCVGGLVVAFLENYLKSAKADLLAILSDPSLSPATFSTVEYKY